MKMSGPAYKGLRDTQKYFTVSRDNCNFKKKPNVIYDSREDEKVTSKYWVVPYETAQWHLEHFDDNCENTVKFDKNTRVLDICAFNTNYLQVVENIIMANIVDDDEFDAPTDEERQNLARKYIRENCLYACVPFKVGMNTINWKFLDLSIPKEHILYGDFYNEGAFDITAGMLKNVAAYIGDRRTTFSSLRYPKEFVVDTFDKVSMTMGFDLVIGFLPEDNAYVQYMLHGANMCRGIASFITSTTWAVESAFGSDTVNEEYRQEVLRRATNVCHIPNSRLLSDNYVVGGYTLVNVATTHSNEDMHLYNYGTELPEKEVTLERSFRKFNPSEGLVTVNPILHAACRLMPMEMIWFNWNQHPNNWRIAVSTNNTQRLQIKKGKTISGLQYILLEPNEALSSEDSTKFEVLCALHSKEEGESMLSYLSSKPVRFITAMSAVSANGRDARTYRFVPVPPDLEHVYTDEEVYDYFRFAKKYRKIVDKLMK